MRNCILILLSICCVSMLSAQTVSNIRIKQDTELGYYSITFDLSGKADYVYLITAIPYKSGKEIAKPRFLSGNGVSSHCSAGKDNAIFWNPVLEGVDKDGWQFRLKANPLPKNFVFVEGGSFNMGSNEGEKDAKPLHQVTVSSFLIGKYEVSQKEWQEVMGSKPSNWKGDNLPVEQVSWYEAVVYCNIRSKNEGFKPCYSGSKTNITCDWAANGYRLPTAAEWEYAARGGMNNKGSKYSGSNDLGSVGWYFSNSGSRTHEVGTKAANELEIYDMSGNVWEWCWDWYDSGYYEKSQHSDPKGADSGKYQELRGGSWDNYDYDCRVANRYRKNPGYFNYYVGFRLVRAIF